MSVPALPNLYITGAPNPIIDACDNIPVNGSKIGLCQLPDKCDDQPPALRINTTAAAAGATSMSLTLNLIGGVTATSTDRRTLTKGSRLYFGAAGAPTVMATIAQDVVLVGAAATTVQVDALPAAVLVSDFALTWGLIKMPTWQDLSITDQDDLVDTTDGESFYGSQGVQSKTVSVGLTYKVTDDLAAHRLVLYPGAVRSYKNIFAIIMRNGFPAMGGACKFVNRSAPGQQKTNTMVSGTLQFMSSLYYPDKYPSQMASGSAELALYNQVVQYSGL